MKFSLCSEVIAGQDLTRRDFAAQCDMAAKLGYAGLEVAPYTLGEEPHRLDASTIAMVRRSAADAGIAITGLHWLLAAPEGLSVTSADAAVRAHTRDVMLGLVELCAALGGRVLVHGSPKQRLIAEADAPLEAGALAIELFAAAAEAAQRAGVVYCIEPLSRDQTNFVNTVEDGVALVQAIGNSAFRTMIDTSSAGQTEALPVDELIRRWLPTGHIGHIQLNDRNRRGPGQGEDDFVPILQAMRAAGFDGIAAVEPFIYEPDGATTAARSIGYLQGILAALD